MGAYCASKHAIVGLSESLRLEYQLHHHNIHVLTVCPAPVKTKFWESTPEYHEWYQKYLQKGFPYVAVEPKDAGKAIYKAALKNKKEIFIPRYYRMMGVNRRMRAWLLIRVEREKLETLEQKDP